MRERAANLPVASEIEVRSTGGDDWPITAVGMMMALSAARLTINKLEAQAEAIFGAEVVMKGKLPEWPRPKGGTGGALKLARARVEQLEALIGQSAPCDRAQK